MHKRIHVEDLTLGMYLHEFCGSWMEHPFWRTRFLLEDPKDLERIYSTAVQEVWIDVSRGKDVAAGKPALSPEEVEERIATDFSALDAMPPLHVVSPELPPPPERDLGPTSTQMEIRRAAQICSNAKQAVVSMFKEPAWARPWTWPRHPAWWRRSPTQCCATPARSSAWRG